MPCEPVWTGDDTAIDMTCAMKAMRQEGPTRDVMSERCRNLIR
jgi:hypothetical protein